MRRPTIVIAMTVPAINLTAPAHLIHPRISYSGRASCLRSMMFSPQRAGAAGATPPVERDGQEVGLTSHHPDGESDGAVPVERPKRLSAASAGTVNVPGRYGGARCRRGPSPLAKPPPPGASPSTWAHEDASLRESTQPRQSTRMRCGGCPAAPRTNRRQDGSGRIFWPRGAVVLPHCGSVPGAAHRRRGWSRRGASSGPGGPLRHPLGAKRAALVALASLSTSFRRNSPERRSRRARSWPMRYPSSRARCAPRGHAPVHPFAFGAQPRGEGGFAEAGSRQAMPGS